jgi:hypothetical protein
VVHVCEATLTKRLIEFENTESGCLTVSLYLSLFEIVLFLVDLCMLIADNGNLNIEGWGHFKLDIFVFVFLVCRLMNL